MSRTAAFVSTLALAALAALPSALDGGRAGRDSGLGSGQAAGPLYRGGWDGNGPDLVGTVDEEQDANVLYRGGWDHNGPDFVGTVGEEHGSNVFFRGGWDRNGPDAVGTPVAAAGAAARLDRLSLEAVELPDGEVIGATRE